MRAVARPTTLECYVSQLGFNVSITFTYAPLLARTVRIYRIFTIGRRAKDPPSLTSPLAQILIASGLILLQVTLQCDALNNKNSVIIIILATSPSHGRDPNP